MHVIIAPKIKKKHTGNGLVLYFKETPATSLKQPCDGHPKEKEVKVDQRLPGRELWKQK